MSKLYKYVEPCINEVEVGKHCLSREESICDILVSRQEMNEKHASQMLSSFSAETVQLKNIKAELFGENTLE